ncbi:porphobilinogen deaminase [Tanacetum coccineum]
MAHHHSDKAKKLLEEYRIGELITIGYSSDSAASSPNTSVHGATTYMTSHLAIIKEIVPTRNALDTFNTNVNSPVYYVMFTSLTIVASVIMFKVQIPKSTNFEGWSTIGDDEVESILPSASYALAKICMHLVYSRLQHVEHFATLTVKDGNGQLRIVDDEVLEDPLIVHAIDEETKFNALAKEEVALLESLLGNS